jgi:hypothetical protein
VADQGAHVGKVRAAAQQLGRASVAQGLGVAQLARDLRGGAEAFDDRGENRLSAGRPAPV